MAEKKGITRRVFIIGTTSVLAGCATADTRRVTTRSTPASEKLNVAAIGSGGKGQSDIAGAAKGNNVVALCDVDFENAAETFRRHPNAKQYRDFREMLDKQGKEIDAVTISTSDHMHAVAALACMQLGKHVYVQKPLTQTVHEARLLTEAARKYGVATQMGNQGHSGEGVRRLAEMIWTGAIGQVKEAHIWTNRPVWPQGIDRPAKTDPVPDTLSWDLFVGARPYRPFVAVHPDTNRRCYTPFVWRGWWDFGAGALGDMACHIMDPAFYCLNLGYPDSIQCLHQKGMTDESFPTESIVKYEFPAREGVGQLPQMDAVTVYWYDGGLRPERPADIPEDEVFGDGGNGSLYIGTNGYATAGEYGGDPRLLPKSRMDQYTAPDPWIPRIQGGHYDDWIRACKGGEPACSNFDYAGPFTETVVIGNVAIRHYPEKLMWDGANMRVTNLPEANAMIKVEPREGWSY